MITSKTFWKDWIASLKGEYFASMEMQVKTFIRDKIERGECPQQVIDAVEKKGKENWKKHFEVLWASAYKNCEGWTVEKNTFLEGVNKRALEKAMAQVEAKYTIDKKILLQMKNGIIRGALAKKVNHLNDPKVLGRAISMKEVESVMKVVKTELGEVTELTGIQAIDKEGEDAVDHLLALKQAENEKHKESE